MAVPDPEAGRVHMAFSSISTALTMIQVGRVRGLAITSAKRSALLPDLPAVAETVPGYEMTGWQGILVPSGTPSAIVNRLSQKIAALVNRPETRKRLVGMGADPVGRAPDQFARLPRAGFDKLSRVMARAGMKAK